MPRPQTPRAYRIGEVARLSGLTPYLLRYYGRRGLIAPARGPAGRRVYSRSDLARARQLAQWRAEGLTLRDLRAIFDGRPNEIRERIRRNSEEAGARVGAIGVLVDRLGRRRKRLDLQTSAGPRIAHT